MPANDLVFDRYELLSGLGARHCTISFRARDRVSGRLVALRALHARCAEDARLRERFALEARCLSRIRHPHLPLLVDLCLADSLPFYTIQLPHGASFQPMLATGFRPEPGQFLRILRGVCAVVDYLHAEGLVHHDLVLGSLTLTPAGRVVVTEHGIAPAYLPRPVECSAAHVGTGGTVAPEETRGEPRGPASDIFALGVLAWTLLFGRPPFAEATDVALYAQGNASPPAPRALAPELPESVYLALTMALARDPDLRPPSARAFQSLLRGQWSPASGKAVLATATASFMPHVRVEAIIEQPAEPDTMLDSVQEEAPVDAEVVGLLALSALEAAFTQTDDVESGGTALGDVAGGVRTVPPPVPAAARQQAVSPAAGGVRDAIEQAKATALSMAEPRRRREAPIGLMDLVAGLMWLVVGLAAAFGVMKAREGGPQADAASTVPQMRSGAVAAPTTVATHDSRAATPAGVVGAH